MIWFPLVSCWNYFWFAVASFAIPFWLNRNRWPVRGPGDRMSTILAWSSTPAKWKGMQTVSDMSTCRVRDTYRFDKIKLFAFINFLQLEHILGHGIEEVPLFNRVACIGLLGNGTENKQMFHTNPTLLDCTSCIWDSLFFMDKLRYLSKFWQYLVVSLSKLFLAFLALPICSRRNRSMGSRKASSAFSSCKKERN